MTKVGLMTKEQALKLSYGNHIVDKYGHEWKVNGKPQIKKRTGQWYVPIKYGLYDYNYISSSNVHNFLNPNKISSKYDLPHRISIKMRGRGSSAKIKAGMKMFDIK